MRTIARLQRALSWLGGLLLLGQFLSLPVQAAQVELPPAVQSLVAKARAEREVAIFVSTDARAGEPARILADAIEADLGVRLVVKLVSGAPDPIYVNQMVQEHKAGVKPKIDLLATVPPLLVTMRQAGLVAAVDWGALGIKSDEVASGLNAVYVAEIARPVIYNTKAVSAQDVPRSIDDLLAPRWKNKIVSSQLPDLFTTWAIGLGPDKAVELVQKLVKQQEMAFAPVPLAIRTQVASGQFPIGFGIRIGKELQAAKAPVAYAPIKAPVMPRLAVVVEGSASPAAAALIGWWMNNTASGRRLIADVLDWPRHTTPGTDLYELAKMTGGMSVAPITWWTDEFPAINARIDAALRAR